MTPPSNWPVLNWKEAATLVQTIRPLIEGLFVDRIVVAQRPEFPDGFLRNEWTIRLTSRQAESALFFCLRPRHPYFALCPARGPKAALQATHSPFTLNLSKAIKGAKILKIEAISQERIMVLWFSSEGHSPEVEKLGLVLCLIPAMPEALLVRARRESPEKWEILARSRTLSPSAAQKASAFFSPPTGSQAPPNPTVREELFQTPGTFFQVIDKLLTQEAFELRLKTAEKELRDRIKGATERLKQSRLAFHEATRESDWLQYGETLKNTLPHTPECLEQGSKHFRQVLDFATGEEIQIPCDPRLDAREQVERFFYLARRKKRRIEEARSRIDQFEQNIHKWETALTRAPGLGDWANLEKLERQANIFIQKPAPDGKSPPSGKRKLSSWMGKTFTSGDGLVILAGRSKDENLDLTFKQAKGNDIWLHVRGRPGAHVVIVLSPGKSPPLETLLDAATLAIYYSGGEHWGKTEVDYTFKKYVRRIKDSTEASYINNKTLIIEPDPKRIKRLLDAAE
ncbi:NFACT RNA binding domain-containing protein [Bdellovibrionota bacterium FG-1]